MEENSDDLYFLSCKTSSSAMFNYWLDNHLYVHYIYTLNIQGTT